MNVKNYSETLAVTEGVTISVSGHTFSVEGKAGKVSKEFRYPTLSIEFKDGKLVFQSPSYTKREKRMLGTFKAHLKNMMKGVVEPYTYKLKICSGHFPMNVGVSNNQLVVKNFVGEKIPRTLDITEGVDVKVEGDVITITSADKERAGQMAGSIEKLCRRTQFDRRIFQQGIFITDKP